MSFQTRMKTLLTPLERRIFQKLSNPQKIQDYLDYLPINFETSGETYMSPRRVLKTKTAHCFEGALVAAAALAYHGGKPLIMDLKTIADDEDHVIALFKKGSHWGAISKTNHAILRYRDPIYRTPRELAMSYAHEYLMSNGRKSLRSYSAPFDLSKYPPSEWVVGQDDLIDMVNALDDSRHFPLAPKKNLARMRNASNIEMRMLKLEEWKKPRQAPGSAVKPPAGR